MSIDLELQLQAVTEALKEVQFDLAQQGIEIKALRDEVAAMRVTGVIPAPAANVIHFPSQGGDPA